MKAPDENTPGPLDTSRFEDWAKNGALTPSTVSLNSGQSTNEPPQPEGPSCHTGSLALFDEVETQAMEQSGPAFEIIERGKTVVIGDVYEPFFARLYALKNEILWLPSEKQFYQYSEKTGLYTPTERAGIREAISMEMLLMSRRDWAAMGITDTSALLSARTTRQLDATVRHLEGIVAEDDPFRPSSELRAHFANGVVIHRGGDQYALEPFSPRFKARNGSPITYEPGAEAPRFLSLLRRGIHDEAEVELVLAYLGQCIFGRNVMRRILIVTGPSGRGKSTIAKTFVGLVGSQNVCELKPSRLESGFEQARYISRTLLTGSDVKGNYFSGPGAQRLKALVGGDQLNPERKNSNAVFEIKGTFNALVTTNEKLTVTINGDADAWEARLLPILYDAPCPEKRIDDYEELLLREEGSGIVNLALAAFGRVLKRRDETGRIGLTAAIEHRIQTFLPETERLRTFLRTCLCAEKGSQLAKEDILDLYMNFAEEHGWEASKSHALRTQLKPLLKEIFGVSESHSVHDDDDDEVRGYRGLAFKDTQPPAQE
jgi:phage/plasmid-associated DNA primase